MGGAIERLLLMSFNSVKRFVLISYSFKPTFSFLAQTAQRLALTPTTFDLYKHEEHSHFV